MGQPNELPPKSGEEKWLSYNKPKSLPLHWAALTGNLVRTVELIAQGTEVDALDAEYQTPLHVAAAFGHLSVVRELVK